jgi:hypothetical protein
MVNENRGLAWCPWLPTRPGLLGHLHGLWIRAQAVFISFSSSICAETYCNIYIYIYIHIHMYTYCTDIMYMYICSWRFHGVFGWCVPVSPNDLCPLWGQRSKLLVRPERDRRFQELYALDKQVGEGSFGNVYKAGTILRILEVIFWWFHDHSVVLQPTLISVECVECVDEYLHLKAHAINASDAASSSWAILPVFHVTKIVVPQSAPPHSGTKVPVAVKARRSDSQTHSLLLISFIFCTTILFVRASWVFLTSLVTWHQGVTRRDGASWFLPILQVFSLASPIASPRCRLDLQV